MPKEGSTTLGTGLGFTVLTVDCTWLVEEYKFATLGLVADTLMDSGLDKVIVGATCFDLDVGSVSGCAGILVTGGSISSSAECKHPLGGIGAVGVKAEVIAGLRRDGSIVLFTGFDVIMVALVTMLVSIKLPFSRLFIRAVAAAEAAVTTSASISGDIPTIGFSLAGGS
ncbi:hypothetical protein GH714_015752 [Hevea brasiliensis]|uniref:Uncharacterized protein n=1 Tax=Hevea brasiliensis TaxID=3981 RepID=A0A6A6KTS7_HEVBR|nr:hypothetical protein GH714_015752 [Hevea brasiliensis]